MHSTKLKVKIYSWRSNFDFFLIIHFPFLDRLYTTSPRKIVNPLEFSGSTASCQGVLSDRIFCRPRMSGVLVRPNPRPLTSSRKLSGDFSYSWSTGISPCNLRNFPSLFAIKNDRTISHNSRIFSHFFLRNFRIFYHLCPPHNPPPPGCEGVTVIFPLQFTLSALCVDWDFSGTFLLVHWVAGPKPPQSLRLNGIPDPRAP